MADNTVAIGFSYQLGTGVPGYDRNNNLLVARKLHDPGSGLPPTPAKVIP
jgi:hypothetical protein